MDTNEIRAIDGAADWVQRLAWARLTSLILFAACAIGGCGGGGVSQPPPPPPPPPGAHELEAVPFAALGAGKIVFLRADFSTTGGRNGIYLIDADRATTAFEFSGGTAWYPNAPSVSPDGRSITYTRYTGSTTAFDVYVANLNGSGEQRVSAFPTQEGPASWTPDGTALVYYAAGPDYAYNIYRQTVNAAATTSQEQITHFTRDCGITCLEGGADGNGRVSVSSTGDIVWTIGRGIELTAPDGSTTTAIYTLPSAAPGTWATVYAPAWSPDGTRVAFVTLAGDSTNGVAAERQSLMVTVMDADGGNESVVTTVPASGSVEIGGYSDIYSLCWSADGTHFAFNVPDGDPQSHIWVVNIDGTALTQVTSAPGVWDFSVSCAH